MTEGIRILQVAGTLLFVLGSANPVHAQFCNPNCTVTYATCPGMDLNAGTCGIVTQAAIDCLGALAMAKGNAEFGALHMGLQNAFSNGRLHACPPTQDGFGWTLPNCYSSTTMMWYWCAGNSNNCICINSVLLDVNCLYSPAGGDPISAKWIAAAALAHEMCHAQGMMASGGYIGDSWTWGDICKVACSELDCTDTEKAILECMPDQTEETMDRLSALCAFRNMWWEVKEGCL